MRVPPHAAENTSDACCRLSHGGQALSGLRKATFCISESAADPDGSGLCCATRFACVSRAAGGSISVAEKRKVWRGPVAAETAAAALLASASAGAGAGAAGLLRRSRRRVTS